MTAEIIMAAIAALASLIGGGAFWRARSQNALDRSKADETKESADSKNVETAERVVALVRGEMEALRKETRRQVGELREEIKTLREELATVQGERDALRQSEKAFREENRELRDRVSKLEGRITVLTNELAKAATTSPIEVQVHPPDARPGGRRTTDPPEE